MKRLIVVLMMSLMLLSSCTEQSKVTVPTSSAESTAEPTPSFSESKIETPVTDTPIEVEQSTSEQTERKVEADTTEQVEKSKEAPGSPESIVPEEETPDIPKEEQPVASQETTSELETSIPMDNQGEPERTKTEAVEEIVPEVPDDEPAPPKTAYDYEFNIDVIRADCIAIGQSMGLRLDASLTPQNATWWNPITASETNQGDALKSRLEQYIRFHTLENLSAYGLDEITDFNIFCETRGGGTYAIYFVFA